MYMQTKRKDPMMGAMDDFWTSDYTIKTHKLNTPRLKSSEDDAYDALWGRGQFIKTVRNIDASNGSRYIKEVKPVRVNATSQLQAKRAQLQNIVLQQKIDAINKENSIRNMKDARAVATASRDTAMKAYGYGKSLVTKAVKAYKYKDEVYIKPKTKFYTDPPRIQIRTTE